MKVPLYAGLVLITGIFGASVALGNPGLLPQHPGYPMGKAIDPVTGQSLANDPGRSNAGGESALTEAAAISDRNLSQQLSPDEQDKRLLEKPAAVQPKKGRDAGIDQPAKGAMKVQPSPQ